MACTYSFNGNVYNETELSKLYKDVRAYINTVSEPMDGEEFPSSPTVGVATEIPGVYNVPNSGLTIEQSNAFIDLLQPQIKKQAYVENKAKTANYMFSFGLRWARTIPNNGEKSKQGEALGRPRPNKKAIKSKESGTYGYFTTDQNNNALPPITDLQPIMDFIESKLGIDLSNYDAMLGNIYDDTSFISQHRDTTESITAENYPVVVINLGSNGHLEYDKDTTSTYAQYKKSGQLDLSNGGIYAFGVDGVNRFTFHHRIGQGLESANPLKPITLPDGTVLKNYRITLTFRRASDLEPGMPDNPNKKKEQFKESAVSTAVETENNPADYTNHSGGAYGGDTFWDMIGREFGVVDHRHYREGTNASLSAQLKKAGVQPTVLTKEQMDTARKEVEKLLGKKYPDTLEGNLQVRNYFQVANSDAVFAIAKLNVDNDTVSGGTNTAVQLGIKLGKPVYVWDINTEKWYSYERKLEDDIPDVNGKISTWDGFIEWDTPTLTKNFAGIGSRDIESYNVQDKETKQWKPRKEYLGKEKEEKAKQAIRDVYANTFQTAVPTSPSSTIDFNSITEFTPERKEQIISGFSSQFKLTREQALANINDALQIDREGTINLLKECY